MGTNASVTGENYKGRKRRDELLTGNYNQMCGRILIKSGKYLSCLARRGRNGREERIDL